MEILQFLLLTVLPFILVLSIVVFVHEFGHFQAARWCKIAVDTFSIGFGKKLAGWRDGNGVEWKVGALPLGGYVKFKDDADPTSSRPPAAVATDPVQLEADRKAGLFHAQPVGARAFVVAAGPLTNFIFAIFAFALVGLIAGRDLTNYENLPARVGEVQVGSAAAAAGLTSGDLIRTADGAPIANYQAFRTLVMSKAGAPILLGVERGGGYVELTLTPKAHTAPDGKTIGRAGLGPLLLESDKTIQRLDPIAAVGYGLQQTWAIIAAHGDFFAQLASPNPPTDQLSGPIGIMDHTGKVTTAAVSGGAGPWEAAGKLGLTLLTWAALLSVAVGIVNLLPIPILDGGHLVFYAVEAVRGKRLSDTVQEWSFRAGLVVLLSIFVFATWNDLSRILPNLLPN